MSSLLDHEYVSVRSFFRLFMNILFFLCVLAGQCFIVLLCVCGGVVCLFVLTFFFFLLACLFRDTLLLQIAKYSSLMCVLWF